MIDRQIEPPNSVPDFLRLVLSTVIDWLKFAEAKNAGLFVATGAGVFALRAQSTPLTSPTRAVIALLAVSAIVSIWSFVSVIKKPGGGRADPMEGDNLFFFGDAAKYTADSYLHQSITRLSGQERAATQEEAWLASQIVINSRIALRKFVLFNRSAFFAVLALVVLCCDLIWGSP